MKVIIMGCGRLGEQAAWLMVEEGHDVTVVDKDPAALLSLGPDFKGRTVRGVGFDRDVLIKAGIEHAEGFAATSSSDNANILSARVARVLFRVPRVVARVYDPHRAAVYRRLGLVTISSTTWGAGRIRELLVHTDLGSVFSIHHGEVGLLEVDVPAHVVGRTVRDLSVAGEVLVVAITRDGQAFIPTLNTVFKAGDRVHLTVLTSAMERLEALLGLAQGDW